MQRRTYNFTSFTKVDTVITDELLRHTSQKMLSHPELGINPHNTQCTNCVELLDKRTGYGRYFIDPDDAGHYYIQQSYFPLHYPDKEGNLRTIDPFLTPAEPGMYRADNQPVPTFYDDKTYTPGLVVSNTEFRLGKKLTLYYLDKSGQRTDYGAVNHQHQTKGDDGIFTQEGWRHIDMQQIFKQGAVKTNYIIKQPLSLPITDGWLVWEEELELPHGYTLQRSLNMGEEDADGYWQGELVATNGGQHNALTFHRPKYYDFNGLGMSGLYDMEPTANGYKVRVLVPKDLFTHPSITYPIVIDPLVVGFDSIGFFGYVDPGGFPVRGGGNFAFTQDSQGSCDYQLTLTVPGLSQLFTTFIDLEYENEDELCVNPPYPNGSQFCRFQDVSMEVVSPCTSTGLLTCDPAAPPFIGTCTTDPTKVPGAGALAFGSLLGCIPPQCPDHIIPFTLKNRTYRCLEVCDYNCARGSYFAITQEARTIELSITADKDSVCIGEPVNLTSFPIYGVPPYTYFWKPTGQTDSVITVYPTQNTTYTDTAFDQCLNWAVDSLRIIVKPSPASDAGQDVSVCVGDTRIIGGNPTRPPGANTLWTAIPASATSLLSSTTNPNPQVIAAPGTAGTYQFIVRVEDATCFTYDTVQVEVVDNLVPDIIASDTILLCGNDSVTLQVSQAFSSYSWSTGDTSQSITVTQSGIFTVSVTDVNGCDGSSDPVTITTRGTISFQAFPDTTIEFGGEVTFYTDLDLLGPEVASYTWSPTGQLSCTVCENPVSMPVNDQTYYLNVITTDGCEVVDSVSVNVILPDQYTIPSAFTPNQDGVNDRFYIIKASGVEVLEFQVFNRWGEVVHNDTRPWDGNYNGFPAQMSTYIYLFRLQLFSGEAVTESGDVTLIR